MMLAVVAASVSFASCGTSAADKAKADSIAAAAKADSIAAAEEAAAHHEHIINMIVVHI